jgi:tetratricopeptide (TPR) repeat protein
VNFRVKKNLALIFALIVVAQNSFAAEENLFRTGIAAYEAGQYDLAAQSFRDSLKVQTASGTLLNLGLAEWRRGREGEAILSWEQATWLNPFNRDTRNNLLFARENAEVNPPELLWFEFASTWLPADLWTWIAGGSLWLAVAMVTLPGIFRARKAGWHQTLAALAFGIFILSLAPSLGIITRSKIGIILEKNSPLRLTPTREAEVVSSLPAGEPVRELRERGNFIFVRTQNGNGWIERGQIGFLSRK